MGERLHLSPKLTFLNNDYGRQGVRQSMLLLSGRYANAILGATVSLALLELQVSNPKLVLRERGRLFLFLVVAMAVGLLFLVATIGLLVWHYLVGPVPLALTYVAIGLGAVAGTFILVSTFLYATLERSVHR